MPMEGEDELQNEAAGGFNPGPATSGVGWNTNPTHQPQAPYSQIHYQPPPYQPEPSNSLPFHLPDPPKDPEPKHPGGFVPYNPSTSDFPSYEPSQSATSARTPEQIAKAQKYCK